MKAAALTALLLFAGCAEQIRASQRSQCHSYGFIERTQAFANCMMQADLQRRQAWATAWAPAPVVYVAPPIPVYRP